MRRRGQRKNPRKNHLLNEKKRHLKAVQPSGSGRRRRSGRLVQWRSIRLPADGNREETPKGASRTPFPKHCRSVCRCHLRQRGGGNPGIQGTRQKEQQVFRKRSLRLHSKSRTSGSNADAAAPP